MRNSIKRWYAIFVCTALIAGSIAQLPAAAVNTILYSNDFSVSPEWVSPSYASGSGVYSRIMKNGGTVEINSDSNGVLKSTGVASVASTDFAWQRGSTSIGDMSLSGALEFGAKFRITSAFGTSTYSQFAPIGFITDKWTQKTITAADNTSVTLPDVSHNPYEIVSPVGLRAGYMQYRNVVPSSTTDDSKTSYLSMNPSSSARMLEVSSNTWYNMVVDVNVDGNADTFDTYTCTITAVGDPTKTATVGPYYLGDVVGGNSGYPQYDLTAIKGVVWGYVAGHTSDTVAPSMELDDIYISHIAEDFDVDTVSVSDNSENVPLSGDISITFNSAPSESTLSNIKLSKSDETGVALSGRLSGNTYTVSYSNLEAMTDYSLDIPTSVMSADGNALATEKTIHFRTADDGTNIFTENFSNSITWAGYGVGTAEKKYTRITGGQNSNVSVVDGAIKVTDEAGFNNVTLIRKVDDSGYRFMDYTEEGKENNNKGDRPDGLNGTIKIGGEFTFTGLTAAGTEGTFAPLGIFDNATLDANTSGSNCIAQLKYILAPLTISNGTLSAYNPGNITVDSTAGGTKESVCAINNGTKYNISVTMNIDGDDTTLDYYTYSISDGTNTYTGGPYVLGTCVGGSGCSSFDLKGIMGVAIGTVMGANMTTIGTTVADNVYAKYIAPPTVTSSVADNATGVNLSDPIALTFSKKMDTTTYANIKLYAGSEAGGTDVTSTVTGTSMDMSYSMNIGNLSHGTRYTLVIPSTVLSADKASVSKKTISFTTGDSANSITISNIKVGGASVADGGSVNLSAGTSIAVTADFTNTLASTAQNATLIIAVLNSNDTMISAAYTLQQISANATENLNVSLMLPADETGAKLKIMAWDGFENMTPLSAVTTLTSN